MTVPGRTKWVARLVSATAWLLVGGAAAHIDAYPPRMPEVFLEDAELTDVFFVDPDHGWAVGDRGVILATDDGGRHWRVQPSPVPCRLESVWFSDERHGWIVGGWTHPYTHLTSGVILRTTDGGGRWEKLTRAHLPALKRVQFLDRRHGWAVGAASALFPAGVYWTDDAGLSWSSVAPLEHDGWTCADFSGPDAGVVVGRGPQVAEIRQRRLLATEAPSSGRRSGRSVRLSATGGGPVAGAHRPLGWLVGDGGLVLQTEDGGRTWRAPPTRLPGGMTTYFDFAALAVRGDRCWIAGAPGTRILHSADRGETWQVFDTGQTLPLRALSFVDDQRGWAVGALGTILATRDGGQSWTVQRSGGERAAWLGLFSSANRVPLEMVVDLSGNDGFLGAVEVLSQFGKEAGVQETSPLEDRLREAVSHAGGSSAHVPWNFPSPPGGCQLPGAKLLAGWDPQNKGRPQARLQEYLVRRIRQWRPEIIITEPTQAGDQLPLSHLVSQAVLAAVEAAADPLQESDQAILTGLEPWRVKKVFSFEGRDAPAALNLTTSQLAHRLATSVTDQAQLGWQRLHRQYHWPAQTLGFRLLVNRLSHELGPQSFFGGIALVPGSEVRRKLAPPPSQDVRSLGRLIQQRRNIEQFLRNVATSPQRSDVWLGQVEELIRGLDAQASGQVLFELARSLKDSGQLDLAVDVYDFLLNRFPNHPLSEAAVVWLVQYTGSSEARQSWVEPRPDRPEAEEQARTYAAWIRQHRPSLYAEPIVRFPLLAAERGPGSGTSGYLNSMAKQRPRDAWWRCAQSELWIASPNRAAPKPIARSQVAPQRPQLDGRLDEPFWQQAEPLTLTSRHQDDQDWPATVLLAHDDDYLYLAAQVRKAPGVEYPSCDQPRPRKAELTDRDRIEILIDVDRDYATYYRLIIDSRGWVRDECLGSPDWNPEWYVAAVQDEHHWTIEAAIAWSQLVEQPPMPGAYWALGVQRLVPGRGFQAWNHPARPRITPEGFGLLRFEKRP